MISIVIPTYNRKEKLKKCLACILAQTYQDFEVIVVDDGSTDNTREIFADYEGDRRIRYIRLDTNSGAYRARNVGLKEIRGDYFLAWDSDDELLPTALEELIGVTKEHPEVDMVCAPGNFYKKGVLRHIPEKPSGPLTYQDHATDRIPANETVILIKRTLLGEDDVFLGPNIDYAFYLRITKKAKHAYHYNRNLANVYLASDDQSETTKRRLPDIDRSIARTTGLQILLNDVGADLEKMAPKRFSAICYGLAVGLLLKGEKMKSLRYSFRASRHHLSYLPFAFFSLIPFSPVLLRWLFILKRKRIT